MNRTSNQMRGRRPHKIDCWATRWAEFLSKHKDWWQRRSAHGEPVYCLARPVIDQLSSEQPPSGSHRRCSPRFLSAQDQRSEQAFTDLCRAWAECVVGVAACGEPIRYSLIAQSVSNWRPGRKRSCIQRLRSHDHNLSPRDRQLPKPLCDHFHRTAVALERVFDEAYERRLALAQSQMVHVAWLIQQADFWHELKWLRARWQELRDRVGYESINGKSVPLATWAAESLNRRITSPKVAEFHIDLWNFAQRWCVASFQTWSLPVPQLPLMDLPFETLFAHRLPDKPSSAIPGYLPRSRLDGDGKIVWQLPTPDPRHLPLSQGNRGGPAQCRSNEVPTYALTLRAYLGELALRSRFEGALPHGARVRMRIGLAIELRRNRDRLNQIARRFQVAF